MLLPTAFIGIVIISALIFTYFNRITEQRTNAANQTDLFIQQVLKGRISAYQFLRSPDEAKAKIVKDDFELLNNHVLDLKSKLSIQENINLCDSIVNESKNYMKTFDELAQKRIPDYKNGIEKETPEILNVIKQISEIGLNLEKQLKQINTNATEAKKDAVNTMNIVLIAIAIVAIIFFLGFSLLLSNQLIL